MDETWIHHYTPETKEQSKQWVFGGERAPKKGKTVKSAGKVMDTDLGCTRNRLHQLLGKRTNDNWSLCSVIAPVERINQEKASSFRKEKDPLPSRQCTSAHLRSFVSRHFGIKIRIITTSTVFTGLGTQ